MRAPASCNPRLTRGSFVIAYVETARSLANRSGRHRPEEPDTVARGHSDRSRREGCGTEGRCWGAAETLDLGRYSLPRFSAEPAGRVKNK